MAGIHRLQEVITAFVAYLAHDDAVGTMAQRGGDKLARCDGNLAGDGLYSFPPNRVRMRYL